MKEKLIINDGKYKLAYFYISGTFLEFFWM
jgi:hypothetical protein